MSSQATAIARPNWLVLGLVSIGSLTCFICLFLAVGHTLKRWNANETLTDDEGWMLYVGIPVFLAMLVVFLLTLRKPSRIEAINQRSFHLRSLFGGSMVVNTDALLGYSACYAPSQGKDWQGIVLYLKNGRHVELNDMSMKPLQRFVDLLNSSGIAYLGTEISWYPLMKWRYKFDPK